MRDAKQTPAGGDEPRLRALQATGLLDSAPEPAFDRFTQLAARLLHAPVALLSLVDEHRQFFKSAVGLREPLASMREVPLSHSFCKHAVNSGRALVVDDARNHFALRVNRAIEEFGIVAYAGIPLIDADRHVLGTLCVTDTQPRGWSDEDVAILQELADATMHEIEQRTATRALQESERFHRGVFDGVAAALLTFDLSRRVTWANASAARMFGYAPGELQGTRMFDLLDPSDRELDRALHNELSDRERTRVTHEWRMKRKDGSGIWVRRTLSLVAGGNQKSVVLASIEEIGDAKQLAAQLQHTERRYRALVRNLPLCGLLSFDRDLRHLVAEGDSMLAAAGLSVDTVVGKTVREISSTAANARRLEQVYRAALRGESNVVEVSRGERWFTFHVAPIDDGAQGGLALVYDSTSQRKTADALDAQHALFRLLHRIADETAGAGTGWVLVRACLEVLCGELACPVGHLLVREGDELRSTDVWHVDDPLTRRPFLSASAGLHVSPGLGPAGRVLEAGRAIASADITEDASFTRAEAALASGLRAAFALPLRVGERVVAVIECFSDRTQPVSSELLDALNIVSALLGRTLDRER